MNDAVPPKAPKADGAPSAPPAKQAAAGGESQATDPGPRKRTRTRSTAGAEAADKPTAASADAPPKRKRKAKPRAEAANGDEPNRSAKAAGESPAKPKPKAKAKAKAKPRGDGERPGRDRGPRDADSDQGGARRPRRSSGSDAGDESRGTSNRDGGRPSGRSRDRDRDYDDSEDLNAERPSSPRGVSGEEDEPEPAVYEVRFPEKDMDQDAVKVLLRLSQHGYQAYLVGGGVRDLLLGKSPKDFDVATSARPQDVRRIFRNCRVIGRRFRLAHVLFSGGKIIEVATFRRDHGQRIDRVPADLAKQWPLVSDYEPTRLVPSASADEIQPDEDLLIINDNVFGEPFEDAIRRDFTINGMFYDIEHEEVIDYVGGMADVERHLLRMIGDPIVRFREDPVRILRAIKFSARLDLGIAADVLDAIQAYRGELARAAKPRILEEIFRLLRGGAAHRSFYLAWDLGVLAQILPELAGYLDDCAPDADLTWRRLAALDARTAMGETLSDAVMVSALLLGPLNEALDGARNQASAFEWFMEEVSERIAMPRRLKDRIRLITGSQGRLRSGKLGSIQSRDFFAEAATLYALDCTARDLPVPDWAIDPPYVEPEEEPQRRRRRRRRN